PRAADLGVSVLDAASALRVLVAGTQVSTFAEGGEQYDIYLRADAPYRRDLTALSQFTIGSAKLGAVPLEQVVQARPGTGPGEIEHFSRRRQVTLTANLLPGTSQSTVLQQLDRGIRALRLGPEYAIEPADRSRQSAAGAGHGARRRHRGREPGPAATDPDDDGGLRRRHASAGDLPRRGRGDEPGDELGDHRGPGALSPAYPGGHPGHLFAL